MEEKEVYKSKRQKFHYIYKIYFLCGSIEGRYYIGKRSWFGADPTKDSCGGSGSFCKLYYKKYGKIEGETYTKEILEFNPDKKTNRDREAFWVGDLWCTDPLCKNCMPGGIGGFRKPKSYQNMSKAQQKIKRELRPETIERMRKAHLGNKYNLGRTWTEERRQRAIDDRSKAINQYDLEGNFIRTWKSAKEAALELNYCPSVITKCVLRKRFSAYKFIWRYKDDCVTENDFKEMRDHDRRIPVCQYTLDGVLVKEHESIRAAGKSIGKPHIHIRECCEKQIKTAYNFVWRHKGDSLDLEENSRKSKPKHRGVVLVDFAGNCIKEFKSVLSASKYLNISYTTASTKCKYKKECKGYMLMYKEDYLCQS